LVAKVLDADFRLFEIGVGAKISDKKSFLEAFRPYGPSYFGMNWDAFIDVVSGEWFEAHGRGLTIVIQDVGPFATQDQQDFAGAVQAMTDVVDRWWRRGSKVCAFLLGGVSDVETLAYLPILERSWQHRPETLD
jgi:hypothetical protein